MKNIKNLLVSLIIFLAALFILMPEIENIASDNIETLKVYLKTTNNDVLKNELKEVADSLGTIVQYVSDSKYADITLEYGKTESSEYTYLPYSSDSVYLIYNSTIDSNLSFTDIINILNNPNHRENDFKLLLSNRAFNLLKKDNYITQDNIISSNNIESLILEDPSFMGIVFKNEASKNSNLMFLQLKDEENNIIEQKTYLSIKKSSNFYTELINKFTN